MDQSEAQTQLIVLARIGLALGLGLLVGLERQRAGKEVGLRTFALTCLAGTLGWLVSPGAALGVLGLVAVVVVILNAHELARGEPVQITTSVALFVTALLGILIAQGQVLIPVAAGILMTMLLAWREELVGFALGLSDQEVRSALTLGILTFIVYPALPEGYVDPWQIVNPREVWVTVILIAAIGFVNYILLRLYGPRGVAFTGLLGGVVNSTATVAELSSRHRVAAGGLARVAYQGIVLSSAAMLQRNGLILAIFAPRVALAVAVPLVAGIVASLAVSLARRESAQVEVREIALSSPFSVAEVLRFGLIFLVITVAGDLAQRALGSPGFYAVSFVGGLASSASATATAATLASQGKIDLETAGLGALLASLASILVDLPLAWRLSGDPQLARRLLIATAAIVLAGLIGLAASRLIG